jgi:hypothetical protein
MGPLSRGDASRRLAVWQRILGEGQTAVGKFVLTASTWQSDVFGLQRVDVGPLLARRNVEKGSGRSVLVLLRHHGRF